MPLERCLLIKRTVKACKLQEALIVVLHGCQETAESTRHHPHLTTHKMPSSTLSNTTRHEDFHVKIVRYGVRSHVPSPMSRSRRESHHILTHAPYPSHRLRIAAREAFSICCTRKQNVPGHFRAPSDLSPMCNHQQVV